VHRQVSDGCVGHGLRDHDQPRGDTTHHVRAQPRAAIRAQPAGGGYHLLAAHAGLGRVVDLRRAQAVSNSSLAATSAQMIVTSSASTTRAQMGATKIMNTASDALIAAQSTPRICPIG
jgi:hypothetical protein